jgi:hypothetical protein
MLEQGKPAKCWQEIASEMADEPDADTLLQFAREMDEALLQEARERTGKTSASPMLTLSPDWI